MKMSDAGTFKASVSEDQTCNASVSDIRVRTSKARGLEHKQVPYPTVLGARRRPLVKRPSFTSHNFRRA